MPVDKRPTLNGSPTKVQELNIGTDAADEQPASGLVARISKAYKNLSLFMAGMYTGVGCSGTPHSHHLASNHKGQQGSDKSRRSGPF